MNNPTATNPGFEPTEVRAEQRRQPHVAVAHATTAGDVDDAHEGERDACAEQHHPDPSRLVADDRGETQQRYPDRRGDVDDLPWQALGASGRSS